VSNNQKPISIDRYNRFFYAGRKCAWNASDFEQLALYTRRPPTNWVYETNLQPVIYRLGYPSLGNNGYSTISDASGDYSSLDPDGETTLIRGGNLDYATNSVIWQSNAPTNPSIRA
jgi:hypothetical protein